MYRFILIAGLGLTFSGCHAGQPGKVLFVEEKDGHYVELREGRRGHFIRKSGRVKGRTDLKGLREVHGNLSDICTEMQGGDKPRIVIDSKNTNSYQVVFNKGPESLKVIAKHLGLVVTKEKREIPAITLRVAKGGHKLKAAAKEVRTATFVPGEKGQVCYEGFTADELAEDTERYLRRPVVNLTSLEGRWSFSLSNDAIRWPDEDETVKLDDLGLELRWENVQASVTVVKDKPK